MKIKTKYNKNSDLKLLWSYVFLVVLLLSNKVSKCQLDSDDSDEVGGSLLSLAAPANATMSRTNGNTINNLFANPIQEKLDKMDALAKLVEKNEQAKLVLNYTSADTNTSSNTTIKNSTNNASTTTSEPAPAINTTSSSKLNTTTESTNSTTNSNPEPTPVKSNNFISKARSFRTSSSIDSTPQSTVVVNINGTNIHNPYGKETFEMRNISIIFIECYGIIFLFLKMLLACFNKKKTFFTKLVKSLLKQSHFYFFFLVVVYIVYIFGAVDKVKNNWEFFLGGIGILGIIWMLMNIFIIIFSTMVIKKWDELENYAKSFSKLKEKLEQHLANESQDNKNVTFIHQCFEYLNLKIYFSIPLFPIFKKMTLRKDFKFSQYLKFCLSEKLRHLFKISWTCWIIAMFWLIFWHVVVAPLNLKMRIYIMFPLPALGLIITLLVYAYMIAIYRRVVVPAEKVDLKDYNDILVYHQNIWDQNPNFVEPHYIQESKWDDMPSIGSSWLNKSINLLIHNNYPSLYDENMFMGSTGFNVFLNLIQCILFLFTAWSTFIFSKEIFNIYYEQPLWLFISSIGLFVLYFFLYTYLISITIRWYTLISSIETRRNEKCLKKTLSFQAQNYAEISQSISYAFKKILYDNVYERDPNNTPFKLSIPNFQKKLRFYVRRFKGVIGKEKDEKDFLLAKNEIEFDIKSELPHFLKSCGMQLNEEELDFVLHISGDKENLMRNKLQQKQLDDIWAAINYFCSIPLHEIYREVFKNYFGREDMEDLAEQEAKGFNEKKIADFLIYYKEYFSDGLCEFMLEEVSYFGANFSLDAFIFRIIGYGALNTY